MAKRSSGVLQLTSASGDVLALALGEAHLSPADRKALSAIVKAGSLKAVSATSRSRLSKLQIRLAEADGEGPICRFDLKCIKISKEGSIDLLTLGALKRPR